MSAGHELVPSVSLANLLNQRAGVKSALLDAQAALTRVNEAIAVANGSLAGPALWRGVSDLVCKRDSHAFSLLEDINCEWAMKRFDATAWRYLLHESGLRTFMDQKARRAWDTQIEELQVPELSAEAIRSTFAQLYSERAEMFERGVIRAFKGLSWEYKTNLPSRLGKRVILTYLCGSYTSGKQDTLDDLLRVLHVLDGKPEPDHRNGIGSLLRSAGLDSGFYPKAGTVENEYLKVTVYKNRNGHVEFKRLDLVEKMNAIIARAFPGALPPPPGTPKTGEWAPPPPDFDGADLDFYATPEEVAQTMMAKARVTPGAKVLEPSAGTGVLAQAARKIGAQVDCIEIHPERIETLRAAGFGVRARDFLQIEQPDQWGCRRGQSEAELYDAIVMNPPFSQRRDVHHVRHAAGFLKKGGRLVAVMGAGVTFRKDELTAEFRRLVDEFDGSWQQLPPGTFKAAGTNVNAVLVTLRRPD